MARKTIIHVNRGRIDHNRKTGERLPPLSVRRGNRVKPATEVRVAGAATVVYRPDKPLPCGAKVWIETTAPVYTKATLTSSRFRRLE